MQLVQRGGHTTGIDLCCVIATQELCSLHRHIEALMHTGNEQISCALSQLDWERLQGAIAIVCDKAMQSMVTAALPLCSKGM